MTHQKTYYLSEVVEHLGDAAKIDPEIKAKWLAALRSGQYKQGKEYLCRVINNEPSFCCLGVLADVSGLEYHNSDCLHLQSSYHRNYVIPENEDATCEDYLAIGDTSFVVPYRIQQILAEMNDDENTFEEIADVIEKHL